MNHEIIKNVIFDQHEVIKSFEIIDREFKFEDKLNYVLVGLRRAGKSTVLYSEVQKLISNGAGWDQIIPEKMPSHDMTINAIWTNNQYSIVYSGVQ